VIRYGATTTNSIWAVGSQNYSADTPGYLRKSFTLDSAPTLAQMGGDFLAADARNVIDDDALIYINGTLVFEDHDGIATHIPLTDVAAYLHEGQNLIGAKIHDVAGVDEHFSMTLRITPIPEPTTLLLLCVGVARLALEGQSKGALRVRAPSRPSDR
jgi:hypothetical protein